MISSSQAFKQFWIWQKLKSPLRVTLIDEGKPTEVLFVRIYSADDEAALVGVVGERMHSFSTFTLEGAEFSFEGSRLVATRNEADWLIFEDLTREA